MDLKLSGELEIPVKCIKPSIDLTQIENFSCFSAVRLAKKYFERQGFSVFDGGNFENNFTLYFYDNDNRMFFDEYIKVKLGKAHVTTDEIEYCETILKNVPEHTVRMLLTLCRFCSYIGDPGFPDLVLVGKDYSLKYVLFDELSQSQKMFLLLSKLLEIEIDVVKLEPIEKEETLRIDVSQLLSSVLEERRSKAIMEGIESNIEEFRKLNGRNSEDDVNYLETERAKNPLFLFNDWRNNGTVKSEDLKDVMNFVLTHSRHDFDQYIQELENDPVFTQIRAKTEDAMKKKAEYMQQKFGIGQTRSKLLLNFF